MATCRYPDTLSINLRVFRYLWQAISYFIPKLRLNIGQSRAIVDYIYSGQ